MCPGHSVRSPATGVTSARNQEAAVVTETATTTPAAARCQNTGTEAAAAQRAQPGTGHGAQAERAVQPGHDVPAHGAFHRGALDVGGGVPAGGTQPDDGQAHGDRHGAGQHRGARIRRAARPQPTMMLPVRMVRLEPSRSTISPDADTETNEPRVMHSRSRPMLPGVRSRPSRMAGSRDTQDAKARPLAP